MDAKYTVDYHITATGMQQFTVWLGAFTLFTDLDGIENIIDQLENTPPGEPATIQSDGVMFWIEPGEMADFHADLVAVTDRANTDRDDGLTASFRAYWAGA